MLNYTMRRQPEVAALNFFCENPFVANRIDNVNFKFGNYSDLMATVVERPLTAALRGNRAPNLTMHSLPELLQFLASCEHRSRHSKSGFFGDSI